MKILVDITHPAHVHFFRNAIDIWRERGHTVIITARDKDLTLQLLADYGYRYQCLSRMRRGMPGLILEMLEHEIQLLRLLSRHNPQITLEIAGTFIVHASKLMRIPGLVFYDTEHARMSNAITYPFASHIITPSCYQKDLGAKHIRYPGYHELTYLHPNRYRPDPRTLQEMGIHPDESYFVIRFVSWEASHDIGYCGLSNSAKLRLVEELKKLGKIIISSESTLPPELQPYQLRISPTKIHDLLAFSTLYIGEGATLASEAAMLGIPSIYINKLTAGTLEEQENRYGLLHRVVDEEKAIHLAVQLARDKNSREEYQRRRQRMLSEKIDVTAWLVDYVENYPLRSGRAGA